MRAARTRPAGPGIPLFGAVGLVAFCILAAGLGRLAGPAPAQPVAIAESRSLRFEDRADGSVAVTDARRGDVVHVLPPGNDGFVRGAMRGLVRERKRRDLGPEIPFELARHADGRLVLTDPATGAHVELAAFGATNRDAFARLLPAAGNQIAQGGTP